LANVSPPSFIDHRKVLSRWVVLSTLIPLLLAVSIHLTTGLAFPAAYFVLYYIAPLIVLSVPLALINLRLYYKGEKAQFYYSLMQWPFVLVWVGGALIARLTQPYNNPGLSFAVGLAWFLTDTVLVVLAWWNWVRKPYQKWTKLIQPSTAS
jgi:hypothetical protein